MVTCKTKFLKTALLMTSFGFIASNAFCGGTITGTVDASIPKYKGDAVVYLLGVKGPVTPQHASVDQKSLVFVPHVTAVPVGSTVDFKNNDKVNHNIFSASAAKKFNLGTYNPGMSKPVTFDKPGAINLLCNVHSEMSAWVVVTENQYAAVSEHDGKFTINNVPAGTYKITAWSEKLKAQETSVTVADGKTATVAIKLAK
ncbi:MAG: carboxypeptidase regulatory-like domain-containing protein [Chlorobiaceae bacterium]